MQAMIERSNEVSESKNPYIQYVGENVSEVEEFIGWSIEVDEKNGDFFYFNGRLGCTVKLGDYLVKEGDRITVIPPSLFSKMYQG